MRTHRVILKMKLLHSKLNTVQINEFPWRWRQQTPLLHEQTFVIKRLGLSRSPHGDCVHKVSFASHFRGSPWWTADWRNSCCRLLFTGTRQSSERWSVWDGETPLPAGRSSCFRSDNASRSRACRSSTSPCKIFITQTSPSADIDCNLLLLSESNNKNKNLLAYL